MVSTHRDGQYVANVLDVNGFGLVRGSSTRGGLAALRKMVRVLRAGYDGAITPDGPRGPAERMGLGTAQIAGMGRVPVVPMGTSGWPRIRFRSWDRFQLALPFARMTVVEGRPILPRRGEPAEALSSRIAAETARVSCEADLAALPGLRLQAWTAAAVGRSLAPAALLSLLFRPARERAERRGLIDFRHDRPVWLHGSSLGELRGLIPLAKILQRRRVPVHLTCFTPTGRELIRSSGIPGGYLPLDVPGWVRRFLKRVSPRALILGETELWPNLLMEAFMAGIPGVLVNARLSGNSLRNLRPLAGLLSKILSGYSAVLARTEADRARFRALGVSDRVLRVWGDSKVLARPKPPDTSWRERIPTERPVLIAGSTRPEEELPVARAAIRSGLFPVMAPRHLSRLDSVEAQLEDAGIPVRRWSRLPAGGGGCEAVLVDVHGILDRLYGAGDLAFVGGTLADLGGHNVLEPMAHGVPFVVGPSYGSFSREVELAAGRGAAAVADGPERLEDAFAALLRDPPSPKVVTDVLAQAEGELEEVFIQSLRKASVIP